MKNIIKSDLYFHKLNIRIYIVAVLIMIALFISSGFDKADDAMIIPLHEIVMFSVMQLSFISIITLTIVTSYFQGKMFENRFLIYQISNYGKKQTIFSKIIVQCIANLIILALTLITCVTLLCSVLHPVEFAFDINALIVVSAFLVLIVRFTIRLVIINFYARNGVLAGIIGWLWIVAELLPWMFGNQFGNERLLLFSKLFLAGQMNYLSTSEDVLHFFPFVIVMSIIETSAECFLVFKKKEVF
jgi:hypothetical protein